MSTEKRRAGSVFGTLVTDPVRVLAAIALAVGLWYYLNKQITLTVEVPATLTVIGPTLTAGELLGSRLAVVLPTDRVVGKRFLAGDQPTDKVTMVLSGPRYLVDGLASEPLDLQVPAQNLDWNTRTDLEFTSTEIRRGQRALEGVTIQMRPPRIKLEVERLEAYEALLRPEDLDQLVDLLVDEQLGQRLRRGTVQFSSDVARILGPASSLAQFRALGTKPLKARLRSSGNERQLTALLELNAPANLGLRLAETPSLTVQVNPVTTVFELDLPLRVDDLALPEALRGAYQPDTQSRRVRIRAGGELRSRLVYLSGESDPTQLRNWAQAHLRLLLWIPPLQPGSSYGTEITLQARLVLHGPLQATVDPADYSLADTVPVTLRRSP